MTDSLNPRCPVHGVRHKRPMCDPDDTPAERLLAGVTARPYEVGDQQDTDLDADIAASRAVRTYTRTYTRVTFANPNLTCDECAEPVEAFRRDTYANLPCGHGAGATSACPSWGPVDGCRCEGHPHQDIKEADRG